MGDPPNVAGALWATRMSNVMALMAQGLVDLGFIGGAEVDRFGNLNTSYIGDFREAGRQAAGERGRRRHRDPVAALGDADEPREAAAGRAGLLRDLARPRRRHAGLAPADRPAPAAGPSAIVTTLGVFRFPAEGGEAYLASVHPGHTVDEVRAETGWDLKVAPDVAETPPPTRGGAGARSAASTRTGSGPGGSNRPGFAGESAHLGPTMPDSPADA